MTSARSDRYAMRVGMLTRRRPVCIDQEASIAAGCRLMRQQRVGELVVTELVDGRRAPAGIVSARDIATRVLALGLDPRVITVGDIVWSRPAAVRVTDSVIETLERLWASGSEALPVLDASGGVAGVLSMDDVLRALPPAASATRFRAGT